MSMKYQIWDKKSTVITPSMEVFTPQQWSERYPAALIDGVDLVISQGTINGAFCQEYSSFLSFYDECDFTGCVTREDHIERINEFEEERAEKSREEAASMALVPSTEERIAAALEAQVLMNME